MQVVNVYEEKFFVANAYNENKMWEPTIMPLFVDIKLRIAEEKTDGGKIALKELLHWMEDEVAQQNRNAVGTKGELVFYRIINVNVERDIRIDLLIH